MLFGGRLLSSARGYRRWMVALAAVAAAVSVAVTGAAPAIAAPMTMPSGAISAVNGYAAEQLPAAELDQQLASMQTAGVQVVRADAAWNDIEPEPPTDGVHDWQFAATDAWVGALAAHHLAWEPIIDYSAWWAKTCSGFCAPTSDSTYATFAQTIAARYGAGGTFWSQNPQLPYEPAGIFEIWNEENVDTFRVAPAVYAGLYTAARTAIDAVDPAASVIVGGLADDSQSFDADTDYPAWYVAQMFAADPSLEGHIDGFGLHPYGATASAVEQWIAHFRGVLTSLGEGAVPIDITEFGWPTVDAPSETWRASMMNTLGADLSRSNCGIRLLAPYDWIDPGTADDPSSDFGLVDPSGTTMRPSGSAWFAGLQTGATLPQLTLCSAAQPFTPTGSGTGSGGSPIATPAPTTVPTLAAPTPAPTATTPARTVSSSAPKKPGKASRPASRRSARACTRVVRRRGRRRQARCVVRHVRTLKHRRRVAR